MRILFASLLIVSLGAQSYPPYPYNLGGSSPYDRGYTNGYTGGSIRTLIRSLSTVEGYGRVTPITGLIVTEKRMSAPAASGMSSFGKSLMAAEG